MIGKNLSQQSMYIHNLYPSRKEDLSTKYILNRCDLKGLDIPWYWFKAYRVQSTSDEEF